jgi:hypothetical protein
MTFGGKDNRGPSIAELQRFVRERVLLTFMLSNGDQVTGTLRWFDESAFQIVPDGQHPFTILRSAVLGYKQYAEETAHAFAAATQAPAAKSSGATAATAATAAAPAASPPPAIEQDIASLLGLDEPAAATPEETAKPLQTDDAGNK